MLKIRVELWPFGSEVGKREIASFDIANDGTGTVDRGNYKIRMDSKKPWIEKAVENYPRNSYHVTKLVYLALKKIYE